MNLNPKVTPLSENVFDKFIKANITKQLLKIKKRQKKWLKSFELGKLIGGSLVNYKLSVILVYCLSRK